MAGVAAAAGVGHHCTGAATAAIATAATATATANAATATAAPAAPAAPAAAVVEAVVAAKLGTHAGRTMWRYLVWRGYRKVDTRHAMAAFRRMCVLT